jgi:hypothetical protein
MELNVPSILHSLWLLSATEKTELTAACSMLTTRPEEISARIDQQRSEAEIFKIKERHVDEIASIL